MTHFQNKLQFTDQILLKKIAFPLLRFKMLREIKLHHSVFLAFEFESCHHTSFQWHHQKSYAAKGNISPLHIKVNDTGNCHKYARCMFDISFNSTPSLDSEILFRLFTNINKPNKNKYLVKWFKKIDA